MKARLANWLRFIPQWVLEHRDSHDCDDDGCPPVNAIQPGFKYGNFRQFQSRGGIVHKFRTAKWRIYRFDKQHTRLFGRQVQIGGMPVGGEGPIQPARPQPARPPRWWDIDRMALDTAIKCMIQAGKGIDSIWRIRNVWTGEIIPAEALGIFYEGQIAAMNSAQAQTASAPAGGWPMAGMNG